jgi:hypothetical protein
LTDDRRRNYRRVLCSLLLAAACLPGLSRANDTGTTDLDSLWEALWHQSGVPTRVARWEGGIRVRLSGVQVGAYRETVLQALQAVTRVAGVPLVDVTSQPSQPANLRVEITADTAMEDNQPCATTLALRHDARIEAAVVRMRGRDTQRCAYHEAMHVMGLRGHPAGKTVLSYFPQQVDVLQPLDQVMLRAWYSAAMRGGMSPFEALQVMANEWVGTQTDRVVALQARDRFFATTIAQMHAYAGGRGDIPAIVRRSGKATAAGIRAGREEMSYFLGLAYLEGAAMPASDPALARHWLQQAASAGNRPAQARLAGFP